MGLWGTSGTGNSPPPKKGIPDNPLDHCCKTNKQTKTVPVYSHNVLYIASGLYIPVGQHLLTQVRMRNDCAQHRHHVVIDIRQV